MKHKVYAGKVHVEINENIIVPLTEENICDWLSDCNDPEILKRIGRMALSFAGQLEEENRSSFYSTIQG